MGSNAATETHPPAVLQLAGHPVRWQILTALAVGDRRVGELAAELRLPQNLASYHLGKLRAEQLVTARRSAADGRDLYYRLDLERMRSLLASAAAALHPGLAVSHGSTLVGATTRPLRVCFLCTGNSARSQMAEALLHELSGGGVAAVSAGSQPKTLADGAVRAMRRRGIDISGRRSKHVDELLGERYDYVISLCDRVREVCPEFPARPRLLHWSIADPSAEAATSGDSDGPFDRAADELASRIGFLLHRLDREAPTSEAAPS